MVDYSKLNFTSQLNTFKNTGVYSSSITLSGNLGAGATATFTSTITLAENQVFVFAKAQYVEFTKGGAPTWQMLPTFDAYVVTTPIGFINTALYATVNGNIVTFTAFMRNPYGTTETIANTTIPITYVTYTVDK